MSRVTLHVTVNGPRDSVFGNFSIFLYFVVVTSKPRVKNSTTVCVYYAFYYRNRSSNKILSIPIVYVSHAEITIFNTISKKKKITSEPFSGFLV